MIIYKNILQKLKDAGYNTNTIRKEKLLSEATLQNIRENRTITTSTINIICNLTNCKIEDIMEHIKD